MSGVAVDPGGGRDVAVFMYVFTDADEMRYEIHINIYNNNINKNIIKYYINNN